MTDLRHLPRELESRFVYNAQWRRVRLARLELDEWRCTLRGPACTGRATEVHHVVDWRDGGALYDLENLRSTCRACHNREKMGRKLERRRPASSGPSRAW